MSYWAGPEDAYSRGKPTDAAFKAIPDGNDAFRIIVADAHGLVRDSVRRILEFEPGLCVVATSGQGQATVDLVRTLTPDLVLLDFHLVGISGLDVLRHLSNMPEAVVVLFTTDLTRQEAVSAIRLGVRGILSKDAPVGVLLNCIRRVLAGELWIERTLLAEAACLPVQQQETFDLSLRELEIIDAIISGACNKEIAQKLGISDLTVKRHLTNIFNKVGVSGRLELALFALAHNLGRTRKTIPPAVASPTEVMRESALPA